MEGYGNKKLLGSKYVDYKFFDAGVEILSVNHSILPGQPGISFRFELLRYNGRRWYQYNEDNYSFQFEIFLTRFVKFQDYNFWFLCLCVYSCCSRKIGRNEKLKPKVVFIVFIYTTKIVYQRGVPQLKF